MVPIAGLRMKGVGTLQEREGIRRPHPLTMVAHPSAADNESLPPSGRSIRKIPATVERIHSDSNQTPPTAIKAPTTARRDTNSLCR